MTPGLCECGCGETTKIAPRSDPQKKWIRGQPLRFAGRGHNAIVTNHPYRQITDRDYTPEDRGYETECWIWNHRVSLRSGHGLIMVGKRRMPIHCAAWIQFVGPIPLGHHLHHLCEQPACVNPSHLQPMTPGDHAREHARLRRNRKR